MPKVCTISTLQTAPHKDIRNNRHRCRKIFRYRDKRFFIQCKVSELALRKKYMLPIECCCNLKKNSVSFDATPESVNCSLFLKNLEKHSCNLTHKKKASSNSLKIYRNIHRKNLSTTMYRLPISIGGHKSLIR